MGKQSIETFKNVVLATPDISSGYRGGLQALGTNSKKINAPDMRLIGGERGYRRLHKELVSRGTALGLCFRL